MSARAPMQPVRIEVANATAEQTALIREIVRLVCDPMAARQRRQFFRGEVLLAWEAGGLVSLANLFPAPVPAASNPQRN